MLEGGREKFLVFAHHKLVLDHITAELEKKVGKTHGYIVPRRPDGMRNVNEVVLLWESLESSLGSAFFPPSSLLCYTMTSYHYKRCVTATCSHLSVNSPVLKLKRLRRPLVVGCRISRSRPSFLLG